MFKFLKRKNYYDNLDIDKEFLNLKERYMKKKYKNIWGGLIQYQDNV